MCIGEYVPDEPLPPLKGDEPVEEGQIRIWPVDPSTQYTITSLQPEQTAIMAWVNHKGGLEADVFDVNYIKHNSKVVK